MTECPLGEAELDALIVVLGQAAKNSVYGPSILQAAAALRQVRQERDQTGEALSAVLLERPFNGGYVHHVVCSGDRRAKPGTYGVSCSCLPTTHKLAAEVASLRAANAALREAVIREYGETCITPEAPCAIHAALASSASDHLDAGVSAS